jgi:hypothetical protein
MNEKPLERLHYYNGMPLKAAEFQTEQDYHIRTRRWLNKSLYSAGIARGLEVREVPGSPSVSVGPGLALDNDGREIILLEEAAVEVCSHSGTGESTVEGNYLVIEYAEETIAYEQGCCAVRTAGTGPSRSTTNWGGPSRIQAQVKFSWVPFVPQPGSNQIVLARVELEPGCGAVRQIDPGVRRYIGAASAATVRQYALEGEREVACLPGVPPVTGKVHFHIRGRAPSAVTLYLRSESLSLLHYTENGHHQHTLDIRLAAKDGEHRHDIGEHDTSSDPIASDLGLLEQPDNDAFADTALKIIFPLVGAFVSHTRTEVGTRIAATPLYHFKWTFAGSTVTQGNYPKTTPGDPFTHGHKFGSIAGTHALTKSADDESKHTHQFESTLAKYSGILSDQHPSASVAPSYSARGGAPLSYFSSLFIAIDGVDRTDAIKAQVVDTVADSLQKSRWRAGIGDGTPDHPLADEEVDAVPIRLDFLPDMAFGQGQHVIEFSVGPGPNGEANGGKLLYNLYVE